MKASERLDKCYDTIGEIAKENKNFYDTNGLWSSFELLFEECKKRIKGLKQIEFDAALEIENDEYSPEVKKFLKRIKYI